LIKLGDEDYKKGQSLGMAKVNRVRANKIFTGTGKDDSRNERLRKAEMRKRKGKETEESLAQIREEDEAEAQFN
jgi:hypothetical protein